ncbi:MAG: type I-B CRISPR-associated protein Cas7/Cst2/DevR [Candidatus Nitrosocaldus sp.]
MRAKFMEVAFLVKVEKTNLNAAGTDGNITSLKKTTEVDDTQRIFISGASIKYAIKQYLADMGNKLSPIQPRTRRAQVTTECDAMQYIDDDLFGYMDTERNVRRVAPVKTNGMIALFPYANDLNRGVRFDPQSTQHSLYDIELVTTVFRSNWAIELDRIGKTSDNNELDENRGEFDLEPDEKEKRVKVLLESLFNLWSRVKQSNYLTSLTPQVLAMVLRDDKTMTIGDKLSINNNYELDVNALNEVLVYHSKRIKEAYIGYFASFIRNSGELEKLNSLNSYNTKIEVMSLPELKQKVLSDEFKFFT